MLNWDLNHFDHFLNFQFFNNFIPENFYLDDVCAYYGDFGLDHGYFLLDHRHVYLPLYDLVNWLFYNLNGFFGVFHNLWGRIGLG